MRRILLNQVKDGIRRVTRRPGQDEPTEERQQAVAMRIERALVRLTEAMDARL